MSDLILELNCIAYNSFIQLLLINKINPTFAPPLVEGLLLSIHKILYKSGYIKL
jgi:hypothetical protein